MSRIKTFTAESMRRIAREIFREERDAAALMRQVPQTVQPDLNPQVKFRNTSGEEIPGYGVMRVTGVELRHGRPIYTVAKPSTALHPIYLINGPLRVGSLSSSYGIGEWHLGIPGRVLAHSTMVYGQRCGAMADSWELWPGETGFIIFPGGTSGVTNAGNTYTYACQDPIPDDTVPFWNDSGEEIPAYAVMRMTENFNLNRVKVKKPNNELQRRVLVNGGFPIAIDAPGHGSYLERPTPYLGRILYDSSFGTPAKDQEWGPKDGQWSVVPYRLGFQIHGNVNTTDFHVQAMQREVVTLYGKVYGGSIATDAMGAAKLWMGATLAVTNYLPLDCYNWGPLLLDNQKVRLDWYCSRWRATAEECDEDVV